jgi:hypothetical protein
MKAEDFLYPMRLTRFAFPVAAMLLAAFAAFSPSAHAQNILRNSEVSVSAFAQFTPDVNGDGVSVKSTHSAGGQGAFRHSYHWWLGYEASYSYTRFADYYSTLPFSVQHNMHEFAGSYLVTAPVGVLGLKPFASAGISAVVFSPSLNGGQNVSWQAKPGANFSVGVNYPLLTSHLGLRVQYRGVFYGTPDYGEAPLKTGSNRLTSEPMAGLYLHF